MKISMGPLGLEPRLDGSKPPVLPLDDRAKKWRTWWDSNPQCPFGNGLKVRRVQPILPHVHVTAKHRS